VKSRNLFRIAALRINVSNFKMLLFNLCCRIRGDRFIIMDEKLKARIIALAARSAEGDLVAWDKLARIISPHIDCIIQFKFWRMGFNHQKCDIENLRQEVLLSIWRKDGLKAIRDRDACVSWISATASNAASNYVQSFRPTEAPRAREFKDSMSAGPGSPLEELARKEVTQGIDTALGALNHKERLVIKLVAVYDKKYKEVSDITGMPIGTVLVCARRAKAKLRAALKEFEKSM